jgi:hypothetical protein
MRRRRATRAKLSTTVAAETFSYLTELIRQGEADNLAEALDLTVKRLREQEARARLEADTAAYYNSLTDEQMAEDAAWGELGVRALMEDEDVG